MTLSKKSVFSTTSPNSVLVCLAVLLFCANQTPLVMAWTTHHQRWRTTTPLFAALPADYQDVGTDMILEAASKCGVKTDQLKIDWMNGRIVITVLGDVYVSDSDNNGDDEEVVFEDEEQQLDDDDLDDEEEFQNDDEEGAEEDDNENEQEFDEPDIESLDNSVTDNDDEISEEKKTEEDTPKGIDISALARAINAALDDGADGLAIAESHEIEVTTPGAPDELQGPVMFRAYKGFDVLVTFMDPKKKTLKTIEGKLHERNNEFTVINIKGRMKKIKNQMLVSVKLPKAMKEKGAR